MRFLADLFAEPRRRIASLLVALGVSPDWLTFLGLLLGFSSGVLFALGDFRWASVALAFSGLMDFLDGEVARVSGRSGALGAFLDSTLDRYADASAIGGILLYYARQRADRYVMLALAALVGALLTSYARARAESLLASCKVGIFERQERMVVLVIAGLAGLIPAALWILAVATHITVVQRITHVARALGRRNRLGETGSEDDEPDER